MLDHRTETEAAVAVENLLLLRRQDLDELLERAAALGAEKGAERGAGRVLAHLGMDNGLTVQDTRELRALLDAWRGARHTAWQTAVKVLTTSLLAALAVGLALKLKLFGGGQ